VSGGRYRTFVGQASAVRGLGYVRAMGHRVSRHLGSGEPSTGQQRSREHVARRAVGRPITNFHFFRSLERYNFVHVHRLRVREEVFVTAVYMGEV